MTERLIAPHFLFRYCIDCLPYKGDWSSKPLALTTAHRLPSFPGQLEGASDYADVRLGWNSAGLFVALKVTGKKRSLWCRANRLEDSDGLQLWIDTRNLRTLHRANRFCHRFALMPAGDGPDQNGPLAVDVPIARAQETPKPLARGAVKVRADLFGDGYTLEALITAQALTGFQPEDHPRIGFNYAVVDHEFGWQTLTLGVGFPLDDPSLWATAELIRE